MRPAALNWCGFLRCLVATALIVSTQALAQDPSADGPAPEAAHTPLRMVIIGDSTVCNYPATRPDRGWGQFVEEHFKDGTVVVINLAAAGRSTKTFIKEGRWEKALEAKPDYVLIQFGHNDSHAPDRPESTDAATDYKEYLRRYITDSRAIGATPILVTPMVRRTFDSDGRLVDNLQPYADAMKEVGAAEGVAVIDLHASSRKLVERLGPDASAEMANKKGDATHFNEKGARAMADLVMEELPNAEPSLTAFLATHPAPDPGLEILDAPNPEAVVLAGNGGGAAIAVDPKDDPVVALAADLFAEDVRRVTGFRPARTNKTGEKHMVIAGTIGRSSLIDQLAAQGRLKDLNRIKGRWEATLCQVVDNPFPGVERALVIAGSDRRGTAYGFMRLSERIGVSPWNWWADVPVPHRETLAVRVTTAEVDAPAVKYRGIFINDEDWGLYPWASRTFDPAFKNIGPKTYEKVFELMLRLRLNYIWPAMHACSTEFGSVPENYELADKYAIVAGSSHCEPMLCNNVHWNEKEQGRWNYSINREAIHDYWEENVRARSSEEAVWTLGIRGIHDARMQTPPNDMPGKINLMEEVFRDQRALLDQYVTRRYGPVAQCFVPYKEVLAIYDAGLKVPDDVTLVWVDDNFGYIRRLSAPAERKRSGGAGVYWHMSYYGRPHSYIWINTTAPALMWEELHKAWENDARRLWVINVGDIKPMEIGVDYFSRLAWNPDGLALGAQRQFLLEFTTKNFGAEYALPMTDLLMEFYRLGTIRKPELMQREWALSLTPEFAMQLEADYNDLLKRDAALAGRLPSGARDAYTELIGFPARVLANTGLIFMADRKVQRGVDASANEETITRLRSELEAQVGNYNTNVANGKWNHMMPGLVTGKDLMKWSSQVRWPWGDKPGRSTNGSAKSDAQPAGQTWHDAATASRQTPGRTARWCVIQGLGPSGRAMVLKPANSQISWEVHDAQAPALEYDFQSKSGKGAAMIDFLPTFRIYPGMQLRVAVSVDDGAPTVVEVPGSSGREDERGAVRESAVQDNYVRARVPLPDLAAGQHTFSIRAIDPGVVIDRVSLP